MSKAEAILQRTDLIAQLHPSMDGVYLPNSDGGELSVYRDGCATVSLYNALRVNSYMKNFDEFAAEMTAYRCIENGSINWRAFNALPADLKFVWMQDVEMPGCDPVDTQRLGSWIDTGATAIVKLHSVNGPERRHYMMALGLENDVVTCLESSSRLGIPILRAIGTDEVLGIRYFASPNYDVS